MGQGIDATGPVLNTVNIGAYGGPNGSGVFNGIIATKAGSLTNTIKVGITGPLGATTKGGADVLQFTNDGGTAGSAGADGAPGGETIWSFA